MEDSDLWNNSFARNQARNGLNNALKSGRIQRPTMCHICGTPVPGGCVGHHYDYARPSMDVCWVCPRCHKFADGLKRGDVKMEVIEFV